MAIISYKGFDKNLMCRDFQYEIGKEYKIEGEIKACYKGFHACENPLEVFDHYPMIGSRFCIVEQDGDLSKGNIGTKICSSKIKIKNELELADMINIGVEWLKEATSPKKIKTNIKDNSFGYSAQIGSSGDDVQIGSSGYSAKIGSSGLYDKIDSTGEDSVIMCAGNGSIAKAKKGSWITLAEWAYSSNKKRDIPICVKTEYVDGEKIKADTYYKLEGGVFVEVGG